MTTETTNAKETETEAVKRTRTNKLTDDSAANVKKLATYRLNKALDALGTFGLCCNDSYSWTDEQVEMAEQALYAKVETVIANIRNGKAVIELAVQL